MLSFSCYSFNALSTEQLYDLIQLREAVFIVEQNCPYLDCDGKDKLSNHVLGLDASGVLQACTRIVPPGISYDGYSSIGRVVTSDTYRRKGQGTPLMNFTIARTFEMYPSYSIKISAQCYISGFYAGLGFVAIGKEYLEDNIPHISMILDCSESNRFL